MLHVEALRFFVLEPMLLVSAFETPDPLDVLLRWRKDRMPLRVYLPAAPTALFPHHEAQAVPYVGAAAFGPVTEDYLAERFGGRASAETTSRLQLLRDGLRGHSRTRRSRRAARDDTR